MHIILYKNLLCIMLLQHDPYEIIIVLLNIVLQNHWTVSQWH